MAHSNNIVLTMLHVDMFKQWDENLMKRHEYGENGPHRWASLNKVGLGKEAKPRCFPTLSHYHLGFHRGQLAREPEEQEPEDQEQEEQEEAEDQRQ
jgi:hypothetical protein